ncbi:MAG: hypothetical protein KatS3mg029_0044 [Saprospiraceae bacterium]|nr:MAG: hypothetical protein KatS3mg029_0044 [Saprospiraceae bacterium]
MSSRQWVIVIGLVLGGIVGGWWLSNYSKKPQGFLWYTDYDVSSRQPYGLAALYALLQEANQPHEIILLNEGIEALENLEDARGTYLYVGDNFPDDTARMKILLDFVARGNHAFIANESFSYECLSFFFDDSCGWIKHYFHYMDYEGDGESVLEEPEDQVTYDTLEGVWDNFEIADSVVELTLSYSPHRSIVRRLFKNKPFETTWEFIQKELLCPKLNDLQILGTIEGEYVNFLSVAHGKGKIFLHNTPLAFTNLPLLDSANYHYVEAVLSLLAAGDIYWDQHKYQYLLDSHRINPTREFDTPLAFVLSQPSLAIAWYILLALGLAFLIFGTKRRQRIIPVLASNANTSLEFIEHIGRIYFLSKQYGELALLKLNLWNHFIRERYRIDTHELDDQNILRLSMRSNVSEEIIRKIVTLRSNIARSRFVSKNTLIQLHQTLETFYDQSHFKP